MRWYPSVYMDNLAKVQEQQTTPEAQELAPISGIREKIKSPESLEEAKERVSDVSKEVLTEAKTFAESILSGPEYEAAQQPITKATEASIQHTTQETLDALNAELASIPASQPANDNTIVHERSAQDAELAAIDAGWDEVPTQQEEKKEDVEENEGEEDKEKEKMKKLEELTQRFDAVINDFKEGGLKLNEDLAKRIRNLRRDGHVDKFMGDLRFERLGKIMGRLNDAGADIRWNKARQEDFEKDYAALKKELGIEAPVSTSDVETPAAQPVQAKRVEPFVQAPGNERVASDSAEKSSKVDTEQVGSTFEAAEPKKKVENMEADEYETHMMANIKGREEILERLYLVPASQRTAEQQHDIDFMELTNGMERKSIEKRREELKLKELEERAESLNKEIEALEQSVAVPASTAMELANADPSTAMVLAGEGNETQDALAQKRAQLAEVMLAIQASKAHILELSAAIAQLDRIRRRITKPVAEATKTVAGESAGVATETGSAAASVAQESGAAAIGGMAGGGASALEYDPNYKGEAKKEKDNGPDLFDVTLSAIHGETDPLVKKVSEAIKKIP